MSQAAAGNSDPTEGSYSVDVIITTQLVTISDETRRRQEDLSAGGPNTEQVRGPGLWVTSRWRQSVLSLIIEVTVNGTNERFNAKYCYFTFT